MASMAVEAWVGSAISKEASYTDKRFTKRYLSLPADLDLVLVFGGVNDFAQNATYGAITDAPSDVDGATFYASLHFLCQGLVTRYPDATVVFMTSLPRKYGGETYYDATNSVGKKLIDYVNAIKEVCAFYSIPVLDLYSKSELYPWDAAQVTAYIPDGLHPNAAGHERIANKLTGFLATL